MKRQLLEAGCVAGALAFVIGPSLDASVAVRIAVMSGGFVAMMATAWLAEGAQL